MAVVYRVVSLCLCGTIEWRPGSGWRSIREDLGGERIEEAAEASTNGGLGDWVLGALARPVPDERSHGQSSV